VPAAAAKERIAMKFTVLLALVLAGVAFSYLLRSRRTARAAEAAAATRARSAARRARVPDVSNNLKGVTASQTIKPLRAEQADSRDDERAA
jgi:Flp pilus assembly protein TadG